MNCLTLGKIYSYLEKEVSSSEKEWIEHHLRTCPRCREAVEERRLLLQASESLPFLEVPTDFAQRVMTRIKPAPLSLAGWLIALGASVSSLVLLLGFLAVSRGENLGNLLIKLNDLLWSYAKNVAIAVAKVLTLFSAGAKIIAPLSHAISEITSAVTSIIRPEIQILGIVLSLGLLAALAYWAKKRIFIGEKT